MEKVYLENSYQRSIATYLEGVLLHNGCTSLMCTDLIFHPTGGGQPSDEGQVTILGGTYRVKDLLKKKGDVYVVLDERIPNHDELMIGEEITCELDWERRYRLMRFHSGAHVLMSAARQIMAGYVPKGMDIRTDATYCEIKFLAEDTINEEKREQILMLAHEAVSTDLQVSSKHYPTIESARTEIGELFRADPDLLIKGSTRVLLIEGFDANPCGGTHVKSLSEIGNIEVISIAQDENSGLVTLGFMLPQ